MVKDFRRSSFRMSTPQCDHCRHGVDRRRRISLNSSLRVQSGLLPVMLHFYPWSCSSVNSAEFFASRQCNEATVIGSLKLKPPGAPVHAHTQFSKFQNGKRCNSRRCRRTTTKWCTRESASCGAKSRPNTRWGKEKAAEGQGKPGKRKNNNWLYLMPSCNSPLGKTTGDARGQGGLPMLLKTSRTHHALGPTSTCMFYHACSGHRRQAHKINYTSKRLLYKQG